MLHTGEYLGIHLTYCLIFNMKSTLNAQIEIFNLYIFVYLNYTFYNGANIYVTKYLV